MAKSYQMILANVFFAKAYQIFLSIVLFMLRTIVKYYQVFLANRLWLLLSWLLLMKMVAFI